MTVGGGEVGGGEESADGFGGSCCAVLCCAVLLLLGAWAPPCPGVSSQQFAFLCLPLLRTGCSPSPAAQPNLLSSLYLCVPPPPSPLCRRPQTNWVLSWPRPLWLRVSPCSPLLTRARRRTSMQRRPRCGGWLGGWRLGGVAEREGASESCQWRLVGDRALGRPCHGVDGWRVCERLGQQWCPQGPGQWHSRP